MSVRDWPSWAEQQVLFGGWRGISSVPMCSIYSFAVVLAEHPSSRGLSSCPSQNPGLSSLGRFLSSSLSSWMLAVPPRAEHGHLSPRCTPAGFSLLRESSICMAHRRGEDGQARLRASPLGSKATTVPTTLPEEREADSGRSVSHQRKHYSVRQWLGLETRDFTGRGCEFYGLISLLLLWFYYSLIF